MRSILLGFAFVLGALFAVAQESPPPSTKKVDVWEPFRFFVGHWDGTSRGQSGEGTAQREYRFVLNNRFLKMENKSVYPPQPQNKKGETHEDLGLFSYDRAKKNFVLRQFHVEGFVNTYALKSVSEDRQTFVFETESIENIAPGWRARETYRLEGADAFVEIFELAGAGKDFELYSETRFRRRK